MNILQVKAADGTIACPECGSGLTYIESVHGWRTTAISGFEIHDGVKTLIIDYDESDTELDGSEFDELNCISHGCSARIRIDFEVTDWGLKSETVPPSLAWVQVCTCDTSAGWPEHEFCDPYWNIAPRQANGEIDKGKLT